MLETWLSKERLLSNSTPRFLTDDEEPPEQPPSVRQCPWLLLLNSKKTEVLIIGPKTPTSNNQGHCLTLGGCSGGSSSSVRNLGVLFDSNLSFDSHVSSI